MDDKEELGQFLSDLAYQPPIRRRHFLNNSKYKDFQLTNYNDNEYAVILDRKMNKVYHIHRGSVNKDDVKTDYHLALGNLKNTERYNTTVGKVNQSTQLFSRYDHIHVGHSLGGTLAQEIAIEKNHKSITFNRGSSPLEIKRELDKDKHVHFRDENDIVSKFVRDNITTARTLKEKDFIQKSGLKFTMPVVHKIYSTYKAHLLH